MITSIKWIFFLSPLFCSSPRTELLYNVGSDFYLKDREKMRGAIRSENIVRVKIFLFKSVFQYNFRYVCIETPFLSSFVLHTDTVPSS